MRKPHIMVIDPAMNTPELDCFNRLSTVSPVPLTYHLPAMHGMRSLLRDEAGAVGIIIFGSKSSVNDRHAWQPELEKWLMPKMQSKIPTFGICYGHQMIANLFGSPVGFLFPDETKLVGFQKVELRANPLWENKAATGELYVSHREVVTKVPESMDVTATRPNVPIDGLAHQTLPIWTFQTHPEATPTFLQEDGSSPNIDAEKFSFGHGIVQSFLQFVSKNY